MTERYRNRARIYTIVKPLRYGDNAPVSILNLLRREEKRESKTQSQSRAKAKEKAE
jgi:hypothetical protein